MRDYIYICAYAWTSVNNNNNKMDKLLVFLALYSSRSSI